MPMPKDIMNQPQISQFRDNFNSSQPVAFEHYNHNNSAKKISSLNASFTQTMQNKAVIVDHNNTVYQDVIQKEIR